MVAVDVFSRFVMVQAMKTNYTKDILQAFMKMISRKYNPESFWVEKRTEFGVTFKRIKFKRVFSRIKTLRLTQK